MAETTKLIDAGKNLMIGDKVFEVKSIGANGVTYFTGEVAGYTVDTITWDKIK